MGGDVNPEPTISPSKTMPHVTGWYTQQSPTVDVDVAPLDRHNRACKGHPYRSAKQYTTS